MLATAVSIQIKTREEGSDWKFGRRTMFVMSGGKGVAVQSGKNSRLAGHGMCSVEFYSNFSILICCYTTYLDSSEDLAI
jgi:hypothetical protein